MKYIIFTCLFALVFTVKVPRLRYCENIGQLYETKRVTTRDPYHNATDAKVSSVDVSPCQLTGSGLCLLRHNTTVKITVDFTARVNTTKVKTEVHGILPSGFINVFLNGFTNQMFAKDNKPGERLNVYEDACASNNLDHCDIRIGEKIHYINSMFVHQYFPKVRLIVKWEIIDDKNKNLACFMLPAEITD